MITSRRFALTSMNSADVGSSRSAPSIIPAGAALDDFLFPADLITYRSGRLGMWTAVGFLERLQPGQVVTVSFGLRITGQPGERAFRFRATPPT